ncbi:MAG: hypothetical protein ACRCXZ_08630 [Patescibacteria group bacterium]
MAKANFSLNGALRPLKAEEKTTQNTTKLDNKQGKTKSYLLNLPEDLHQELKEYCIKNKISIGEFIKKNIEKEINKNS